MHATTPNIVGATMFGVVHSVWTQPNGIQILQQKQTEPLNNLSYIVFFSSSENKSYSVYRWILLLAVSSLA